MPDPVAPPQRPLDLAVLVEFGARLHLFTREKGEEVRARLRQGLGKSHGPAQIAEWLHISEGELDGLIRAVRRLPRGCSDADLVAAFRRRPTADGLPAVGAPRPAPPADAVAIGTAVFADFPEPPTLRRFDWGRPAMLWVRMGLLPAHAAADFLLRIETYPKESLTTAVAAEWLGIHEATLERMLRLARTLPDDVTEETAREAFEAARQADPHDLGTMEFGVTRPSSSMLKAVAAPAPPPPARRPSDEDTKPITAPPPAPPQRTLEIRYGEDLLAASGLTPEEFAEDARLLLAAKLYELGNATSAQAAGMCGKGRDEFLQSLPRIGFAVRPEDAEPRP